MARSLLLFHTLLPAIFLILSTHQASRCAAQIGFQSINCGGDAYYDSTTEINWSNESTFMDVNDMLLGRASNVASNFRNVSHEMTTLRYFPQNKRISKYCYSLNQVYTGSTYLVRASFLYGNYDTLNKPPSFVLLFNYDMWTNVTTSSSANPVMHELTFISKGDDLSICLAPQPNSNHTPFISTLELRHLNSSMYSQTSQTALATGHGLMLFRRINYGARNVSAIRYPDDPFDRIWEANTTGPPLRENESDVGTNYIPDPDLPPVKVMATAITTQDTNENLTFVFEGLQATALRVELHFQELDQEARVNTRSVGASFPNSSFEDQNASNLALAGPSLVYLDQAVQIPTPFKIKLFALLPGSPLGPLLNAIEIFRWTPDVLSTSGTFQEDVDALQQIRIIFNLTGYGQGDPCKPEQFLWTWIVCSLEDRPRITQINLANFNLKGPIPSSFNKLTHLQKIDLSNNALTGEIPDLASLSNLESLDLQNNNLNGELPRSLHSLQKLNTLHVDDNELCGDTTSFQNSNITTFTYLFDEDGMGVCMSTGNKTSKIKTISLIIGFLFFGLLFPPSYEKEDK